MNVNRPQAVTVSNIYKEEIFDSEQDTSSNILNQDIEESDPNFNDGFPHDNISATDASAIPPSYANDEKSNFIRFADVILNVLNPYLDLIRSSIPSNEEMLIRNLPEIRGKKIIVNQLKKIDDREEIILNTPCEKSIHALQLNHCAASSVGIAASLITAISGGAYGILSRIKGASSYWKFTVLATSAIGSITTLAFHRYTNQQETAREWILIRLKRLKRKIRTIDLILTSYGELKRTEIIASKISQLQLCILGLKRIIQRCVRIYNHSLAHLSKVHLPTGGLEFNYFQNTNFKVNIYHTCSGKTYEYIPTEREMKTFYIPPTAQQKEIYKDVQKIKRQGDKIDEVV